MSSTDLDSPIICEPCLGPNPYIRMTKDPYGKACKICTRPFTVFRWNPGTSSRFKKTEICSTCAKVKNVCQTCILDLQYGLPVQVRDAAMGLKTGAGGSSDHIRAYAADVAEKALEGKALEGGVGRMGQDLVRKTARKEIEYKRDRTQALCSAFARGKCDRGEACPFKHELPSGLADTPTDSPSNYSQIAPTTARKQPPSGLPPPQDPTIVSLFISSLPSTTEPSIRSFFLDLTPQLHPQDIKSITHVASSKCAFVNFRTRQHAELAAKQCEPRMLMHDQQVRVTWGRSRPKKEKEAEAVKKEDG